MSEHEQLTQREINWIEGWIDAFETDPCAVEIMRNLVEAARGAHDAEQRAEILEAALERLIDAADPHMAAQDYAPDPRCGMTQPISVEEGEELNNAAVNARETITRIHALQSAPPASEPQDANEAAFSDLVASGGMVEAMETKIPPCPLCGGVGRRQWQGEFVENCQRCGGTGRATDPTSEHSPPEESDRPEPSEALEAFNTFCADFKELTGIDPFGNEAVRTVHSHFSQPAPAVPEKKTPERGPYMRGEKVDGNIAWVCGWYDCARALAQPSESPAVQDRKQHYKLTERVRRLQHRIHDAQAVLSGEAIAAAPTPTDDGEKS